MSGGPLYYSENAQGVTAGTAVSNAGSIKSNLAVVESRTGIALNVMHPIPGIFLIYGSATESNDTIKINLNQFEDRLGLNLSGTLVITFDGSVWIPSVIE